LRALTVAWDLMGTTLPLVAFAFGAFMSAPTCYAKSLIYPPLTPNPQSLCLLQPEDQSKKTAKN
jgi:hypothetical protein